MNRNKKAESMRAGHKVRKMRMGTTDSKRSRQARARTRARRGAVALPLALVALALPLATADPQGAAHAATGGHACAPPLASVPHTPTVVRVLRPGQRLRVRGGFSDVQAYKRGGTAMCQRTFEDRSHVWTHGRYRVTLDAPDGPRYFTNHSPRTVLVAVWVEG